MPRTSHYRSRALSCSQVRNAIAADRHAKALGFWLNFTMDIHWAWTRFGKKAIWNRRKAIAALLESQRHWLAYHGVGFFSMLVREAPIGSSEGEHAHQLVHVPDHLHAAFLGHTKHFLGGNKRLPKRALAWRATYSDGKLAYMLKGCTPPARELLSAMFETDFERQHFLAGTKDKTQQGVIYGKRLLISQALGPKARLGESHVGKDNRNQLPEVITGVFGAVRARARGSGPYVGR
jgi:hypothetical protein